MMPGPTPDTSADAISARTLGSIREVSREVWDGLSAGESFHPFTAYDFLDALETSGSVDPENGWAAHHLVIEQGGDVIGAMPLYMKGHSQGEYIFDHSWAEAYMRAGGAYYPKLLGAVPFTPATGPRLLAPSEAARHTLANAARQVADHLGVSSLHINFPDAAGVRALSDAGYMIRHGQQFRFDDDGYGDWNGFLGALSSRKRKDLRKERARIAEAGVEVEWITGAAITEELLDQFWVFYQDTGARKWGTPYLTRAFFSEVVATMAEHIVFIMARRGERTIAGAMNFIGGDTLYGRYWGCTEHVPFLHFELCYYQAIDFALAHGLQRVEAGAQGEHKIARGYSPVTTYSAHYIPNDSFREAVGRFLEAEREQVAEDIAFLDDFTPFKKG